MDVQGSFTKPPDSEDQFAYKLEKVDGTISRTLYYYVVMKDKS
jgi:hypothetical protein